MNSTTKEHKPINSERENVKNLSPNLRIVPLKYPNILPRELIENVKGRTFEPEDFIKYLSNNVDNPVVMLYVLIDDESKIHGYIWIEKNLLDNSLFINTFSVSKEHWGKGKVIDLVIPFLEALKQKMGSKHVFWITTNPKFFQKRGFKVSKNVLMEYTSEKEVENGKQ